MKYFVSMRFSGINGFEGEEGRGRAKVNNAVYCSVIAYGGRFGLPPLENANGINNISIHTINVT